MAADSTQQKILDSAERLFGEYGIGATSLRSIIADADVNIAAIHYHFGSKDELVREVFGRRINEVNEVRLSNLQVLREKYSGSSVPVEELFRAFLAPAVALTRDESRGGLSFARLVARAHAETDAAVQAVLFSELKTVLEQYLGELEKSATHLTLNERRMRMLFAAGAMVQTMLLPLRPDFMEHFFEGDLSQESMIENLVRFCTVGMESGSLNEAGR